MIQTFERMRELFPVLNKRVVTDAMVRRACGDLETDLYYQPLALDGYFVPKSVSPSGRLRVYVTRTSQSSIEKKNILLMALGGDDFRDIVSGNCSSPSPECGFLIETPPNKIRLELVSSPGTYKLFVWGSL